MSSTRPTNMGSVSWKIFGFWGVIINKNEGESVVRIF